MCNVGFTGVSFFKTTRKSSVDPPGVRVRSCCLDPHKAEQLLFNICTELLTHKVMCNSSEFWKKWGSFNAH